MAMTLMQLNTGGLVTCELRVLITELREGRDEWRLNCAKNKFMLEFQSQVSQCLGISYRFDNFWTFHH